ncbi:MAG: hypothetical protein ACYS32_02105 [Planctomycetota bacterium]
MSDITHLKNALVILVFFVSITFSTAAGKVIYVDDYGPPNGNGSSWPTAYRFLQDGLAAAQAGDEIRVAQGFYWPDEDKADPNGTNSRYATFQLKNNVTIKGGYAGSGKPDPDARNIDLYETILSGDLLGNDIGDINNPSRNENSFHVLTGTETNASAILDGFTITAGSAAMDGDLPYGGGILAIYGSPTVANCTFSGHSAYAGAGACFLNESSPRLTNCTFVGNSAEIGGGLVASLCTLTITTCTFTGNSAETGGAVAGITCTFNLTGCTFTGNSASQWGGAFYNESNNEVGSATLINCVFSANTCSYAGGAMHEAISRSSLYNCLFTGNSCSMYGGAMYSWYESRSNLFNCTFSGNSASNGNAIACNTPEGYEPPPPPSTVQLSNCILWNGGNEIFNDNNSVILMSHSDVHGGWLGTGNIETDPCFADADNGDCHLKSEAGRWDPNSQSWVKDGVSSPCIDIGDPDSDWRAELWPHGCHINIGAYGGTPEASMSLWDAGSIADLDIDGRIGGSDLKLLTGKWLYEAILQPEDLSRDGIVNFIDFSIFAHIRGLPSPASEPNPADGGNGVSVTTDLSWIASPYAISHDVYFGTSNPPPFIRNQSAALFDPGTISYSTKYYWRIDEVGAAGKTNGMVWSFFTLASPPPPPPPM